MTILTHQLQQTKFAELITDKILIENAESSTDLMGSMYYQGFEGMIVHEKNIHPDFFDLRNGMAGEILQKFSNYKMKLIILGDFTKIEAKSLRDFIFESNKQGDIVFSDTIEEVRR